MLLPGLVLFPSTPEVTVGPPTLVLDPGEGFYFNPDSAFPFFLSADGKTKIAIWGPGKPTRYVGPSLDAMAQSGPYPAPVTRTPGLGTEWDSAGTWMLAASRATDGTLVALTHVEDHTFADGGVGEWNSSGIMTSNDDGRSWTNRGQICGEAKPEKARYGGLDLRVMAWNPGRRAWIGYCGAYAFESKDPHAAPGTWYGYHDGAFSQRIDPARSAPALSEAPGLSDEGPRGVTWGSLSWNAYLKRFLYVWRAPGATPHAVEMALSEDGLHWASPTTLFADPDSSGNSLDYPTFVGASSALTGQEGFLVYARVPSTGLRQKDMVERWVHFGTLLRPATPMGVRASGRPGYDAAVTVSWSGVPMAQAYDVWRKGGGEAWRSLARTLSSAARPAYVDREARLGASYAYRVVARNREGASGPSAVASASPALRSFEILNRPSGLALEAEGNEVRLQPVMAGRKAQGWRFSSVDGRRYRIVNEANGLMLDVPVGTAAGTRVRLSPAQGTTRSWLVQPIGPEVALIDDASGFCLDGFGGGQNPGTAVDIYPYRGSANQRWLTVAARMDSLRARTRGEVFGARGKQRGEGLTARGNFLARSVLSAGAKVPIRRISRR